MNGISSVQWGWSLLVAAAAGWIVSPITAAAQERQLARERAGVTFGVFAVDRASTARLDSDAEMGTDIDLENGLGLERRTTAARVGGYVWIKPRQRLDFSLFDLSRDATSPIDGTIEFGDEVFDIDTVVSSDATLRILKSDYTFAPISGERGYLGVNGGLYTASFKLALSEPTLGAAESEDLTAPLPVVGFRGEYQITARLSIDGAAQWFRVDTAEASGRLRDSYVGADYAFDGWLAMGIAYNDVSMNLGAEETGGFVGRVDWGYDGWWLYLKARFGG